MLILLDLPADLILALCRRMLLSDLISFLSTCRALRGYTSERSLWIDVLHRTQYTEMQPIAQPIPQDLSKLNLDDLRNGPHRRPGRYGRSGRGGSTSGNRVACWNIRVHPVECCASLDLGAHVVVEAASFDKWGQVLLGDWDPSVNVHRLLAIRIDYRALSAVSTSLVCSHDFVDRPRPEVWPVSHVSARRGAVSVVVSDGMGLMYTLLTVSFDGRNKRIIPIKLPTLESPPGLTTQLVPSSNGPYLLRHIERGSLGLPLAPLHRHTIIQVGLPASDISDVDQDFPARPTSDVLKLLYSTYALEFWPPGPGEQPVFGPKPPIPMRRIEHCVPSLVHGAEYHIAAASPLGRYALVVDGKQVLLSRFGYGGTREDRPLELEGVNSGSVDWSMAMDDSLGLVLALRGNGTLRIFSYAIRGILSLHRGYVAECRGGREDGVETLLGHLETAFRPENGKIQLAGVSTYGPKNLSHTGGEHRGTSESGGVMDECECGECGVKQGPGLAGIREQL
ncbi:hypothetical protein B0H13DRAFT_1917130 [Mycena leptocephala]|nr:hypothetical protein B0H13DRAFT_1917130 [Mycena leptocephala]